jgi:deazaflavin-dependent oxidoreductase (nitroreductase family)
MPNAIGNFFVTSIASSPLHPLLGPGLAVIAVQGRKTGKRIVTPINVTPDETGFTATSLRSRNWWRNLRSGGQAELRVGGRLRRVCAEVVEEQAAVAAGFARYFEQHPNYARYFGLPLGSDGRPAPQDLERLAAERVIVRLRPSPEA